MFLKKIVKEGKLYNFSSKYAASVGQGKGEQWPSILQSFSILFIPLSKKKSVLYSKCGKMHKIGAHYHFQYVC